MSKNIMYTIGGAINKVGFKFRKHSPEILVVAGVIGTVTSAVMACKATTKVSEIMEGAKKDVDAIHSCLEDEDYKDKYSEEDGKKDLLIVYARTGVKFVKLYAPSVILGALSLTGIVASNNILRKRNVALAAAYATIDKSFKDYRNRVVERFGDKVDKELKYGIKAMKFEETVTDDNGKEKKVKKTVEVMDPNDYSGYAMIFDESNPNWEKDSDHNRFFLQSTQAYMNDKLKANKRLFLNEVYEALGFQKTKAGQVVGWVYDEDNSTGDNFVDFGIFDVNKPKARDFVNGYERSIILDFNVDGNVWENM